MCNDVIRVWLLGNVIWDERKFNIIDERKKLFGEYNDVKDIREFRDGEY